MAHPNTSIRMKPRVINPIALIICYITRLSGVLLYLCLLLFCLNITEKIYIGRVKFKTAKNKIMQIRRIFAIEFPLSKLAFLKIKWIKKATINQPP